MIFSCYGDMERQIWSLAVGGICLLIFSLFPEMLTPPPIFNGKKYVPLNEILVFL